MAIWCVVYSFTVRDVGLFIVLLLSVKLNVFTAYDKCFSCPDEQCSRACVRVCVCVSGSSVAKTMLVALERFQHLCN